MKDIKNESKICCQKNIHQFISNKKKEIISFQFEQVDVLSTLNILEIHSFDFFLLLLLILISIEKFEEKKSILCCKYICSFNFKFTIKYQFIHSIKNNDQILNTKN